MLKSHNRVCDCFTLIHLSDTVDYVYNTCVRLEALTVLSYQPKIKTWPTLKIQTAVSVAPDVATGVPVARVAGWGWSTEVT